MNQRDRDLDEPNPPAEEVGLRLPIVLAGLPGSGKSKVGRALARRLGVPHVDTDDLIVESQGRSIAEIFAVDGEASFRRIEAGAVARALTMDAVVSLGGGAVTTPAVREILAGRCVVVLDVDHEELLRRTSHKTHRPLLQPDPDAALRRLRVERTPYYEEVAAVRVHSDSGPASDVVEEVVTMVRHWQDNEEPAEQVLPGPETVDVGGIRPYPVIIGHGLDVSTVVDGVRSDASKVLLIHPASVGSTGAVLRLALEQRGLEVHTYIHPDGEAGKTLEVAASGWDIAGAARLGRADTVIGLGGGATTDLAGFVAATWLRGIDVVQVPSTLLGMVDAAVGGKTGINTAAGKNLVGAFHTPVRVVEELGLLATLAPADLRAGLGEVIKCGLIADQRILDLVEADPQACVDPTSPQLRELVVRSVAIKARVVGEDLTESGLREILNYGHTMAHAIERCENFAWRHGDAVAVGCVFAAELAHDLGLLTADEVDRHRRDFSAVGLPTSYSGAPVKNLVDAMLSDKKVRGGHLRFVLLDGLRNPVVREVDPEALRAPAERIGIDVH